MENHKHLYLWLSVSLGLVLFIAIFQSVLLPFVLGMILGYLLDPLVDKFEKINVPRGIASLLVLIIFFAVIILLMALLWPVVRVQFTQLVEAMPGYVQDVKVFAASFGERYLNDYGGEDIFSPDKLGEKYGQQFLEWGTTTLKNIWSGGAALFSLLSLLVVTPIVAFYLLRDWDRMVLTIDRFIPVADREVVHKIMQSINETLSGFLRGQALVCVLLGGFYALGLTLTGLDFGLVIGLFIGVISFIPYVGAVFGGVLCVGLAALQFGTWEPVIFVGLVFAVGQFLEGNILSPKLVGDNVNLHPVWIVFALMAGGALLGFTGVMIAVPVAAVLGVLTRHALDYYLQADLYSEPAPVTENYILPKTDNPSDDNNLPQE